MGPGTMTALPCHLYFKSSRISKGTSLSHTHFSRRCFWPCMGGKNSVYSRIFQYAVFLNHFSSTNSIFLTGLEYKFHVTGKLAAQL